jgi:hypothetical protein
MHVGQRYTYTANDSGVCFQLSTFCKGFALFIRILSQSSCVVIRRGLSQVWCSRYGLLVLVISLRSFRDHPGKWTISSGLWRLFGVGMVYFVGFWLARTKSDLRGERDATSIWFCTSFGFIVLEHVILEDEDVDLGVRGWRREFGFSTRICFVLSSRISPPRTKVSIWFLTSIWSYQWAHSFWEFPTWCVTVAWRGLPALDQRWTLGYPAWYSGFDSSINRLFTAIQ